MATTTYQARASAVREYLSDFAEPIFNHRISRVALYILIVYVVLALVGPSIPGIDPYEIQYAADGSVAELEAPSVQYPLGTTQTGYDIVDQLVMSFRTSLLVGIGTATFVLFIGVNLGLITGYYGGKIDSALMAVTDVVYGLPLLPFAIAYIAVMGQGLLNITLVLGIILWRTIARVIRSETLSVKEREYIKSARAIGTSDFKIMYFHILPNLLPLIAIYFVFGATWGVIIEASLSFIGLGDPNTISWGLMLHQVFTNAAFSSAWWWVLTPSIALWLFIWCLFVIARTLEENVDVTEVRAS